MTATRGSLTTERTTARILVVGYDGTDPARAARAAAIDRAGPDDIVVGVYARMPVFSWLGTPYYERAVEAAVQSGQRIVDDLDELTGDADVRVEFEVHEGRLAEALLRIASGRDAAAIFVGSPRRRCVRATLGSVSHELLRRSDRPVLVVPPQRRSRAAR